MNHAQLMALSRVVLGCLLLLVMGFIWIPIGIVHNDKHDAPITMLAAELVDIRTHSTSGKRSNNLETSEILKILKTLQQRKDKGITTTRIGSTNTVGIDQPMNVGDFLTTWIDEERLALATEDHYLVTTRSNQSNVDWTEQVNHTMLITTGGTTTSTCNQMTYLRKTTLRWIQVLCEMLKRQPPIVKVGLLVMAVLTSLVLAIIGYKLICPRVHNREGIERHYDVEDSWLMFA